MGLVEPASSLTDFLLAIIVIGAVLGIREKGRSFFLWRMAFIFMGIAALMGGVHHGFFGAESSLASANWGAITIVIAISLSFVLAATVTTVLGRGKGRSMLAVRGVTWIPVVVIAVLGRASVTTLIITESLVMVIIVSLWVYAWRLGHPGVSLFLLAIGASMLAALVKGLDLRLEAFGWDFDANALYHLAQIPGVVLLYLAVRRQGRVLGPETPATATSGNG